MANCNKIDNDVLKDCANPILPGVNDRLILLNYDDVIGYITNSDLSPTDPNVKEGILLASGTRAYEFEGQKQSNEPAQTVVPGRYVDLVDHQVRFKVFSATPNAKKQIQNMLNGSFIAIVQNNYEGVNGNAAFEIYGADSGLYISEGVRTISDVETGGAFDILLKSSEQARESKLPYTLWKTSFVVTKAIVDALLT